MDRKEIDLEPHQWTARVGDVEQPKPPEPFWGPGWPIGLQVLITSVVGGIIAHWWRGY